MSRSHSIKRVHAETCVKSSALEQGEHHGLIPVVGSGTCDKSIHVVNRAKMILDSVPQEVCDLLGLYVFVADDYRRWSVGPFPEDILGNMGYDAVCVRAPARPQSRRSGGGLVHSPALTNLSKRVKRDRNGSFDLVGVESNPGPTSKAVKKAAAAIVLATAQGKKKKVRPGRKTRGGNSSAGYGGFMNEGRSAMSNAVGPRVQGMNLGQTALAAAYATGMGSSKPRFSRQTADSTKITHRELVGSLVGSLSFAIPFSFSINPGLPATFPWLSSQAVGWEKYKFNYLRLCSYTRTGSTTPGSIIMSPDYNAFDAGPVSEQIMSSYYGTREDAPWKDICLEMDTARMSGERFLRYGALAANQDIKTYDVANVFVGTVDGTAVGWSKLWWEYEVVFFNPQLPPGGLADAGTVQGAGVFSAAVPFGSLAVVSGPLGMSTNGDVVTVTGLTPGVEYSVTVTFAGTVLALSVALGGGFTTSAKTILFNAANAGSTAQATVLTDIASGTVGTITISGTATTITSSFVVIASLIPPPAF